MELRTKVTEALQALSKQRLISLMNHLNTSQYQAEPNTIKLCLKQWVPTLSMSTQSISVPN